MTEKRSVRGACTRCGWRIIYVDGQAPDECPNAACKSTLWRLAISPATVYEISTNDRRFLKALRIDGDG